jgi:hypothetical protein
MPRSHSFDPFQVPAAEPMSRGLRKKSKQPAAMYEELGSQEEGVHYGHTFAETEAHFHGGERTQWTSSSEHAATKFSHPRPATELVPDAPHASEMNKPPARPSTMPIGALPTEEALPPQGRMQDLLDDASRQMKVLQTGLEDATRAASRLVGLPLEALRMAARRLRIVHG